MLIYGTVVHTPKRGTISIHTNALLATNEEGRIVALKDNIPEDKLDSTIDTLQVGHQRQSLLKLSATQFILPGLIDTHIHAPQITYTGTATDIPLMDWLQKYTFPSERQFEDPAWARKVYDVLVRRLLCNGTTTALYFASIHLEASKILADSALKHGQRAFIGKVCMDQNGAEGYIETTEQSIEDTKAFIAYCQSKQRPQHLVPVITPRFLPTCSPALLEQLGALARQHDLPIQSHISESLDEVAFVHALYGNEDTDTEIFDRMGLLTQRSVMAHGVHLSPNDVDTMVARGSAVAVCPLSNVYFANGVFPVQPYQKLKMGLGTDVAGGYSPSMLQSIRHCAVASRYLATQKDHDPSLVVDWMTALYMATLGGAEALGLQDEVGSFELNKSLDALLVDIATDNSPIDLLDDITPMDMVEKFINLGDDRNIISVWISGERKL
ncbi:guanine deaminase-like [Lichtheimia corymbifera JMRC:FSU:9682]|uniref:Guanine deaminase n=1 Tax=Lichtheimia corymbifera JMRC:FSU:9682 TaxID=1263082 RepID=A0A068SCY3_9FUNG|nr:guanine deaminase-like [Lichtheimia corymbifera JMRC:FSU:9682]